MKVIFLVIIFPALYHFVCCGGLDERLPSAMNEGGYQALYNALLAAKIDVINLKTTANRRYVLKET